MYRRVEENAHMTINEAAEQYPDEYVLMQRDNRELFDSAGIVLYIGDDGDELFSLQVREHIPLGIVIEGMNHRCSLGGLAVGE